MNPYTALAKELLANALTELRTRKALTQEEMAERLHISCRAYSDLERKKSCASTITALFLFSMLDGAEQQSLVQHFSERIRTLEDDTP